MDPNSDSAEFGLFKKATRPNGHLRYILAKYYPPHALLDCFCASSDIIVMAECDDWRAKNTR